MICKNFPLFTFFLMLPHNRGLLWSRLVGLSECNLSYPFRNLVEEESVTVVQ
jgi:hypothetical protein